MCKTRKEWKKPLETLGKSSRYSSFFLEASQTNTTAGWILCFFKKFYSHFFVCSLLLKSVTPSKDSSSHVCSNEVFPGAKVLIMSGLCRVINTVIASHSPVITCISLLTALPPARFPHCVTRGGVSPCSFSTKGKKKSQSSAANCSAAAFVLNKGKIFCACGCVSDEHMCLGEFICPCICPP